MKKLTALVLILVMLIPSISSFASETMPELAVEPTPERATASMPELTAEPSIEPTTAPTPELIDAPTPEPSPGWIATPTPGPTAETTPGLTAAPIPGPTADPTPEPTVAPTTGPTAVPTIQPSLDLPAGYNKKFIELLDEAGGYFDNNGNILTKPGYSFLSKTFDELLRLSGLSRKSARAATPTYGVKVLSGNNSIMNLMTTYNGEVDRGWSPKRSFLSTDTTKTYVSYCVYAGGALSYGDNNNFVGKQLTAQQKKRIGLLDFIGRYDGGSGVPARKGLNNNEDEVEVSAARMREFYTQVLLWEDIATNTTLWKNSAFKGAKVTIPTKSGIYTNIATQKEYNEFKAYVMGKVDNWEAGTELSSTTVTLTPNNSTVTTVTDANNSLLDYTVTAPTGITVTVAAGSLKIKAASTAPSSGTISLKYKPWPSTAYYSAHEFAGYYFDHSSLQTVASAGGIASTDPPTYTIKYDLNGTVAVTKTSTDGKNIDDIDFKISGKSTSGAAVNKTVTTGSTGKASFTGIPVGTYTVSEVVAPAGYDKAVNQNVTVTAGKTATLTFQNILQTGTVNVKKTSTDGLNLSGRTFSLTGTSTSGTAVKLNATTNSSGAASFTKVPIGTYTLAETNCPAGYTKPANQSVTVTKNGTVTKTFSNVAQLGNGAIIKTSTDGLNLSGRTFSLTGTSTTGKAISLTATTDAAGKASFSNVLVGTYTLAETNCPAGYDKPANQSVTITSGGTVTKTFNNVAQLGSISITKTSTDGMNLSGRNFSLTGTSTTGKAISLTATTDAQGKASFKDVLIGTYTLTETNCPAGYDKPADQSVTVTAGTTVTKTFSNVAQLGNIEITKTSTDNKNLGNIQFSITGTSTTGKAIKLTATTDSTGKATLSNVPVGKYTASELNCPPQYKKPTDQTVTVENKKTAAIAFFNKLNEGQIKLVKKCSWYQGYLSGAEYTIYKADGTDTGITLVSDSSKWVYSPKFIFGDYYLKETKAPQFYALNSEKIPFKLDEKSVPDGLPITTENDPLSDVYPEYITPNSAYRSGTEVIVSYKIYNDSIAEHNPDRPLKVQLTAVSQNAKGQETQILSNYNDVIVPYFAQNLTYWKVKIPGDSVKLKLVCTVETPEGVVEVNTENNTDKQERPVQSYTKSETPDTAFEDTPSSFTKPSGTATVPTGGAASVPSATWQQYVWENNSFALKTYGATLQSTAMIKPDGASFSAKKKEDESWTMKSGYGITIDAISKKVAYGDKLLATDSMVILPQHGNLYVPEFSYSEASGKYRTLDLTAADKLEFEGNPKSITKDGVSDNRRVHFTPLWYPDGDYTVKTYLYDCWTPAGMLNSAIIVKPVTIDGNMYQDWYINNVASNP